MNNLYFSFFFFLFSSICSGQNLVPNHSFEDTIQCPVGLDQLNRCQHWTSYANSPDYFNVCSQIDGISPPMVDFGYQMPVEGEAYTGIATYSINNPNYREVMGAELLSSLEIGNKYFFSFYAVLGGLGGGTIATNKVGILFSTIPYNANNPTPINNFSHFSIDTILTDTVNWHFFKGDFVADSAYNYIAIGSFFDDNNTDTVRIAPTLNYHSYFLIDNVCVSSDSTCNTIVSASANEILQYNIVLIYPNPSTNTINIKMKTFQPYTIQLLNFMGDIILENKNDFNENVFQIDVRTVENGSYFLKISSKEKTFTKRISILK